MLAAAAALCRTTAGAPARSVRSTPNLRSMASLVLAEPAPAGQVAPATLHAIAAATKLSDPSVTVLVLGDAGSSESAAAVARVAGVKAVVHVADARFAHPLAEDVATLLVSAARAKSVSHVFAAATSFGKNAIPRAAAELDVAPISEIIQIKDDATFVRPIYAGNAIATVRSKDTVKLITVRTTAFPAAAADAQAAAPVETLAAGSAQTMSSFKKAEVKASERPELTSAKAVVSGGRGLKSKENFALIEKLADSLGAGVGASRAAVDAGYAPNDYQIGQTGKIVAPQLYIAIGISGAIQHLAGMKDSKVIVAINKDPDAPIFSVADYGLVEDLFTAVPELTKQITAAKSAK